MKLLKNSLLIVALFTIGSAGAYVKTSGKKGSTTSTQQPAPQAPALPDRSLQPAVSQAPALPGASFMYLLEQVRRMPANQVINANGVFTDSFTNMVKSANLTPELTRALLEAGRNLHLPLSGDNDQNMALMGSTDGNINKFMASLGILVPVQTSKEVVVYEPSENEIYAEYYNGWETTIKQDYLEKRIKELLRNKTGQQVNAILIPELSQKMRRAWTAGNVENTVSRTKELEKTIKDTVARLEREQKQQGQIVPYQGLTPQTGAIVPYQPLTPQTGAIVPYEPAKTLMANFYDPATKLIRQDYLEERVKELVKINKTADEIVAILSPELTTGLGAQWRISKVKVTPALLQQANQQIKGTVAKLAPEYKQMLKTVDYIEDLVLRNETNLKKDLVTDAYKQNYKAFTLAAMVKKIKQTYPSLDPMIAGSMLHEAIVTNPLFKKNYSLPRLDSFIEKVIAETWNQ